MKKIFLIVLLFSSSVFASKNQTTTNIPADSQLIDTTYGETGCYKSRLQSTVQNECAMEVARLKQERIKHQNELETECSEITTNIDISDFNDTFLAGGNFFGGPVYKTCHEKKIIFTSYCKPRTLSEMAKVSLLKHCIQNYDGQCAQLSGSLDQVKPTQYKYEVSGRCR